MSEPTGYVLTEAIDAPPIMHLNPTAESKCGGRVWNEDDPTIEGSDIIYQQVDEKTARALLDSGQAIPCRRCDTKDEVPHDTSAYTQPPGAG